jgi:hypothetical protein
MKALSGGQRPSGSQLVSIGADGLLVSPTPDPTTPANDGRALEAAVASFFKANHYDVQTNVVLEGRSGGRHEIDVLAVKRDALTSVTIAVECKAWQHPVEKDVVSKLHYLLGDLGLNKGIVVSVGGFRSGADRAARELSIDLWGPDELKRFLGPSVTASVAAPRQVVREAIGWPFGVDETSAVRVVRSAARGSSLLRRQEEVLGVRAAWVPAHLAYLTLAEPRRKRGREILESRPLANIYEGLAHSYLGTGTPDPPTIDLADIPVIPPMANPAKVKPTLEKAFERARSVTTNAAKARHASTLGTMGIPAGCRGLTVDRVDAAHMPVWLGLLRLRDSHRLVAVNGNTGALDEALSKLLTTHISHVRSVLG